LFSSTPAEEGHPRTQPQTMLQPGKNRYRRRSIGSAKKKKKKLIACRGLGRVVGPLLAARALPLRCAASTMLSSTLLAI
jgi:hypothetical protein